MNPAEETQEFARLSVENVGGIDRTEVALRRGVTVLAGRNASNRTSLLRALMAALGSDDVSLKGDADEGIVELSLKGDMYTRTLERTGGRTRLDGEPYLEDPEAAELFAFLLGSNEARRGVVAEDDLRDLVMRPVDTDQLREDIRRLEEEKRELDAEIEEVEALESELPGLEQERDDLVAEIEELEDELDAVEADIESHSADIDEKREEQTELEAKMEELRSARNRLEELRHEVRTQEKSLDSLEEDQDQLEAELDDYPEPATENREDLEEALAERRRRKSRLVSELNELQSVIQFNEELLEEDGPDLTTALDDDESDAVTDKLLSDDTTVCWTCGSEVQTDRIEDTLDELRELRRRKQEDQRSVSSEIEKLEEEKRQYEETRRKRERTRRQLEQVVEEIDRREDRLEELRQNREQQAERVDELEAEVEDLETEEGSELLELHREANELEFEIGRLRNQLDEVEDEISTVEARIDELDDLMERRESVEAKLRDCRTRIRSLENDAVEQFNHHMEALLDRLEYDNLDRIWIERVDRDGPGAQPDSASFELHVVRSTDDGVSYEDTVGHLSESEREVTGLVFALAGYFVHDIASEVPFMLLDSLEAIDADRIAEFVEYVSDYPTYLVVALLSEDAAALDDSYHRVTDI